MISSPRAGTLGPVATGKPGAANLAVNIWGTGEVQEGEEWVVERKKWLMLNICQLQKNIKAT